MEDISREWWIGYICAYVVVFGAIAGAAWYFMPRPEAPPPVAQEAPPPPAAQPAPEEPEFRYPERPKEPEIWALFQKAVDSRIYLPSFRIVVNSITWRYPDATPETGYTSAGEIVNRSRTEWLVKGDKFREELSCSFNATSGDPNSERTRPAPFTVWRVQNGRVYARWYDWTNEIRAHRVLRNEIDWAPARRTGYAATWAEQFDSTRARLLWSMETQRPEDGGLIVVRGEASPDEDYQQLRCEFVIDPARDYLIARSRYWLQGKLNRETVIEARQSPDGPWFPSKVVSSYGDRMWTSEYGEVKLDVPLDDSQFEIESLPCDLEAVELTMFQDDGIPLIQHYRNGRWIAAPRKGGGINMPNAKLEWAEPRE